MAGRSRSRDVLCALAAGHRPPRRQGLPSSSARGVDRPEGVQGKPEPPGCGALHHPRVRRSGSCTARAGRGAVLREDRAVGAPRAPHALAHLRAARHVAGRDRFEHGRLQGRGRPERAAALRRGPRGLPRALLADIRGPDGRPARRGEEERRAREADRRPPPERPRHPQLLSRHASALHHGNRAVGSNSRGRPDGQRSRRRAREHAGDVRPGRRLQRRHHVDVRCRHERREAR